VVTQEEKHDIIFNHFLNHIGAHVPKSGMLNLGELDWQPRDLQHLEVPFTEDEVKVVIMEAPKEKALRYDGYIGRFFSHCWNIIKDGIFKSVEQFYMMNQQDRHLLNQALVVNIPQKCDARGIS
jgi:hypothetical protein